MKRPIEDVEGAEKQGRPPQSRLSIHPHLDSEHEKTKNSYDSQEEHFSFDDSGTDFRGLGAHGMSRGLKGNGSAESFAEYDGNVKKYKEEESATRNPISVNSGFSPHGTPHFWGDLHEADRILFKMRSSGCTWLEIGQVWEKVTGNEVASMSLANRYSRLMAHMQEFLDSDDACLLAAVDEVRSKFKREQWKLISEAMGRRGVDGHSENRCRRRYRELVQVSSEKTAAEPMQKELVQPLKDRSTDTEHNTAGDSAMSALRALKTLDGQSVESRGVATSTETNDAEPRTNEDTVDHVVSKKQLEKEHKINDFAEKLVSPKTNDGRPGSLLTNAILVEDLDEGPRSASALPKSRGFTSSKGGSPLGDTHRPATEPPKGLNSSIVSPFTDAAPSPAGSAIKRGPAGLFSSREKLKYSNGTEKSRKESSNSNASTQVNRGFGMLVLGSAGSETTKMNYSPNPKRPSLQEHAYLQNQLSRSLSLPGPAPYNRPSPSTQGSSLVLVNSEIQLNAVQGQDSPSVSKRQYDVSSDANVLTQSIEIEPQVTTTVPFSPPNALTTEGQASGTPGIAITKEQLETMIQYRTMGPVNRSKPWDVIARECGIIATLTEISNALEKLGFPSIVHASTEDLTSAPTDSHVGNRDTRPTTSTQPSWHSIQSTAVPESSGHATSSQAPSRVFKTPSPARETQAESTSSTDRRRGRPPKSTSGTPTKAVTPISKVQQSSHANSSSRFSAIMKAAWARRKAREADKRHSTSSKTKSVKPSSKHGDSAATYAAQILAAAAARTSATPTPGPQHSVSSAADIGPKPDDDEPRDLLTGKTMFEQHYESLGIAHQPPEVEANAIEHQSQDERATGMLNGKDMAVKHDGRAGPTSTVNKADGVTSRGQPQDSPVDDSILDRSRVSATTRPPPDKDDHNRTHDLQSQNQPSPLHLHPGPTSISDVSKNPINGQYPHAPSGIAELNISPPGPKLKKIRGPYKKSNKTASHIQLKQPKNNPTNNPKNNQPLKSIKHEIDTSLLHTCAKCGKTYLQFQGLRYHQKHHPNCDIEPRKHDKRTDPVSMSVSEARDGQIAATTQMEVPFTRIKREME